MPGYIYLDGDTSERTFDFTVGEFSQLYISKLPLERTLTLDRAYRDGAALYGNGGMLFGGHRYAVHWYADDRYTQSGDTSSPMPYAFSSKDPCFINVAHKGKDTGHSLHAWLGYKDMQTGEITETAAFDRTGMQQSRPGERKNYYTCEFD